MPTTYKSILLYQPTDGELVFMRRFTRDPPVLAIWQQVAAQFQLIGATTLTGVGGPDPGTFTPTYAAADPIFGSPAWFNRGVTYTTYAQYTAPNWVVGVGNNALSQYYESAAMAFTGGTLTSSIFTAHGAPGFAAPTSITLITPAPFPLTIPAAFVSAWRPQ